MKPHFSCENKRRIRALAPLKITGLKEKQRKYGRHGVRGDIIIKQTAL
jgi:hypothetical protein